jgi:RNA polymerase primary sigma factor
MPPVPKGSTVRRQSRTRGEGLFPAVNPVAAYLNEISLTSKLTSKAERILAARSRQGDRAAMNALVQANLKFVVAVCRNYEGQGLPLSDLIGEGNLGLLRAAARFDENRGCRFISYAVWWIRQGIMTALAEQSRDFSLSTATTMAIHKVNVANRNLFPRLGRMPTVPELELETGFKAERIDACLRLMEGSLSLDYATGPESVLQDSIADESESGTDALAERFQIRRALAQVMNGLDRRERMVIESFFGLEDGNGSSLRTLAAKMGISKERVRQLKAMALAKLKGLLSLSAKYPCAYTLPA